MWRTLFVVISQFSAIFILNSTPCAAGRKNDLNLSKGDPDPNVFWPIQRSKHNIPPRNSRTAVLHNVAVIDGPVLDSNGDILDAMKFLGTSSSYVVLQNTDGSLDGGNSMCWGFYIYVTDITQDDVTLLEYGTTAAGSGFKLKLKRSELGAEFSTSDGWAYSIQSTSITLDQSTWTFVGVNFNKHWTNDQFDFFKVSESGAVTSDTLQLGSSEVTINAIGDTVRLGSSHDGTNSFEGEISCLQFYEKSLIKNPQEGMPSLCDPNIWSAQDYGENTADETTTTMSTTTTTMMTTTTTTQQTTTEELETTTDAETTSSSTTTTTPVTTTTTFAEDTTTTTTSADDTTTITSTEETTGTATTPSTSEQQGQFRNLCPEECCNTIWEGNVTEEVVEKVLVLKKQLQVDKKATSASVRSRTSASDDRMSARVVGSVGISIMVIIACVLVLPDLFSAIRYLLFLRK